MAEIGGIKSMNPVWQLNTSSDQKKHKQKSSDKEQDDQEKVADAVDDIPHIDDYA